MMRIVRCRRVMVLVEEEVVIDFIDFDRMNRTISHKKDEQESARNDAE